jgi:hypothetical protein
MTGLYVAPSFEAEVCDQSPATAPEAGNDGDFKTIETPRPGLLREPGKPQAHPRSNGRPLRIRQYLSCEPTAQSLTNMVGVESPHTIIPR